jgi:hypothetical protein
MADITYGFGQLTVSVQTKDIRHTSKVALFSELFREMSKAGGPLSMEAQQEVDRVFDKWANPVKGGG